MLRKHGSGEKSQVNDCEKRRCSRATEPTRAQHLRDRRTECHRKEASEALETRLYARAGDEPMSPRNANWRKNSVAENKSGLGT